jgi:branched-chain amino acid transport system substrate-binding protein
VLVTQMIAAGLEGVKFFGCDGTFGTNYLDLAGDAAEGTFSTNVPIPESGAFDQFRSDYQAAYGDEQGKLSPFSPHGYDAMSILINAVEKVAIESGSSLVVPRKALADEVRSTADYQGLTGMITCSEIGECAAASILFMVVENGDWVKGPGQ